MLLWSHGLQSGLANDGFAECAGGFGQRGRGGALQHGTTGQVEVVITMSEFVRQGTDAPKSRFVVCHHPRLISTYGDAESAIAFTCTRFSVDPLFAKGVSGEVRKSRRVSGKLFDDERSGFVILPDPFIPANRGIEIIPCQAVHAEHAGLGMQIAAKAGKRFASGFQHSVERLAIHIVIEQ